MRMLLKPVTLFGVLLILLLTFGACRPEDTTAGSVPDTSAEGAPDTSEGVSTTAVEPLTPADPVYTVPSEAVNVYSAFEPKLFRAQDRTALPYRLFLPDGYDPDAEYPVVLFLHEAGERGNNNTAQLANAVQSLFNDLSSPIYGAIVVCPQCPANNQWVDTPWSYGNYSTAEIPESNELKAVIELLEDIKETYPVDEDRIYGFGLSMGGFGIWDILMRHPALLAAGVPVCGGADVTCAELLVDKPIWTVHGSADAIVPLNGTRRMVSAIEKAGGERIIYEELAGYGHEVWEYAATNPELIRWLFEQSAETAD